MDIAISNIVYDGNRASTAEAINQAIANYLRQQGIKESWYGPVEFVDVPLGTNKFEPKCMAFMSFVNDRVNLEATERLNGLIEFRGSKLVMRLSENQRRRTTIATAAWRNPTVPSTSMLRKISINTVTNSPEIKPTTISASHRLCQAMPTYTNDVSVQTSECESELQQLKQLNATQAETIKELNHRVNEQAMQLRQFKQWMMNAPSK